MLKFLLESEQRVVHILIEHAEDECLSFLAVVLSSLYPALHVRIPLRPLVGDVGDTWFELSATKDEESMA